MQDGDDPLEPARIAAGMTAMEPGSRVRPSVVEGPELEPPERRDRRLAVGIVVVVVAIVVGVVLWLTRSPGQPLTPTSLRATTAVCDPPCDRIEPSVTVTWTQPEEGARPASYRILRDGAPLDADLDGTARSFVDASVTVGESYEYQVIAQSPRGDSPPSAALDATVPTPPADVAHLDGVYRVEMTVRSARSIGAAFGIDRPIPGKRGTDRWSFDSTCAPDEGACPSEWTGLEGEIVSDGLRWRGRVDGRPARCRRNERAPAPIDVDLRAVDVGVVDSSWVVTAFRGTARVSFRCPGFPPASATVEVTGRV
jgi:hypothetical protein